MTTSRFIKLLEDVRACKLCEPDLPLGAKPLLQVGASACILIAGQAPGRVAHVQGVPFDDKSGERLRAWLGVTRDQFYDAALFAIVPMGFCFPGVGASGDLAPRIECAAQWRDKITSSLPNIVLTLAIGQYAQRWHCGADGCSLTERVKDWQANWPKMLALPHPSPRNNRWLKNNPWFELDVVPELQLRVRQLIGQQ